MNQRLILARCYLIARMQEASTWRGLVVIATSLGIAIKPEQSATIISIGLGLAGVLGAMFPDAKTPPTQGN